MSTSKCWFENEESASKQDPGWESNEKLNNNSQDLKSEAKVAIDEKEDFGENLTEASNDHSEESKTRDLIRTETEEDDSIYDQGFYDAKITNKNQSRKYSTPSGITKSIKWSNKSIDGSAKDSSDSRHSLNCK